MTNYTDRISINLLNSTVDSARIRNGVVGLMISEMSNGPSYHPSVQMTTPPSVAQPERQQIVVVQPPAQYITVNSIPPYDKMPSYDKSYEGTARFERNIQSKYEKKILQKPFHSIYFHSYPLCILNLIFVSI